MLDHCLRDDAVNIWTAGVDSVRSENLVQQAVRVDADQLQIMDQSWPLEQFDRILVVGAGKAGAGMAAGLEQALGSQVLADKKVSGWLNVPDNCVRELQKIHLRAARPAARNEPTEEGMHGAQEILRQVRALTPRDLCICLISGGGSALLPAPCEGVSLHDKLRITRHLSAAGANIQQINAVRTSLSAIKGGGLARACGAGVLITLIISDVMGDPLDTIASGPTVPIADPAAQQKLAQETVDQFGIREMGLSTAVLDLLTRPRAPVSIPSSQHLINRILGNNETAITAAASQASQLGYVVRRLPTESATTLAEEVGRSIADELAKESNRHQPVCLISGGEPVVQLVDAASRGLGGRNQQLVLAALDDRQKSVAEESLFERQRILSGGTDGEDGPTDAAGGFVDRSVVEMMIAQQLNPAIYLQQNDAYHFLERTGGLLKTGPTHTNVCDVRIGLQLPNPRT